VSGRTYAPVRRFASYRGGAVKGRAPILRYLPLAAIVIVQILIIAIAPSKSPGELGGLASGPGGSTAFDGTGDPTGEGGPGGVAIDPTTGQPISGGASGGGPGGGPGGPGGGGGQAAGPTGDTSHCVGGRQYDPAVYPYSPPCVGKWAGGNNGGATYRGVTGDTIKIVKYLGNLGEAVDALLTAQGANPGMQNHQNFARAVETFAANRYELYGRKVSIEVIQGRCKSVPPDYPCLRNEMREIVQSRQPFWVNWHTSLASPAFDELSRLKVMNSGGWGFRDIFNQQRRPYHWDLLMGGSQHMRHVADWYCKRMHGGRAEHAGEARLQAMNRVVGVISTDDPENRLAIRELKDLMQQQCGAQIAKEYYYAQDINTAQQQRDAAYRKMKEAPEATTIICFCDLVAPIFLYQTCEEQRYYPEHVVIGSGYMDADAAAQAYDNTLPPRGTQFHNAFGLAQQPKAEFREANAATRVWRESGRTGAPHQAMAAEWDHYGMILAMLQSAGPNLNPLTVEAGALRMGEITPEGRQNEYMNPRGFGRGDYTWIKGMREVFWSPNQQSPFNRQNGTYVTLNNGRWFYPGEYPSGLLKLPPKPR